MNTVMINLPEDRYLQLKEMAVQFKMTPEELAAVSLDNFLKQPEDKFLEAMNYVLKKNEELYKRLA